MNDLQKDQAIYQAMLQIADNVFNKTMETNEGLKVLIKQYGGFISLTDILKQNGDFAKNFFMAMRDANLGDEIHEVAVDTFSCSFPSCKVYSLLKYWKSLARIKGEQVFMYEEKIENEFVGSVEVELADCNNAKLLTKHVANDRLRPIMNFIVADINATRQTINFVGCDGVTLSAVSNNPARMLEHESTDTTFRAIFLPDDWKRICDFAKKNDRKVTFDIYRKKEQESFDTYNVHLGNVCLRSNNFDGRYPNWYSVVPDYATLTHQFSIVPEDRKAAQDWLKRIKNKELSFFVSFYRGSNLAYFDCYDAGFDKTMTATFRLSRPSDVTIGSCYKVGIMQKIKFTGFCIDDPEHGIIIRCEESDLMLVMPRLSDKGYVRDVEEREVVAVEELAEAA